MRLMRRVSAVSSMRIGPSTVASVARLLFDDRFPPAHDAVDERGLADVRPADHGNEGRGHGQTPRAWRNATPSVATTSTGRGRSPGVVPSRNAPLERHTSGSR